MCEACKTHNATCSGVDFSPTFTHPLYLCNKDLAFSLVFALSPQNAQAAIGKRIEKLNLEGQLAIYRFSNFSIRGPRSQAVIIRLQMLLTCKLVDGKLVQAKGKLVSELTDDYKFYLFAQLEHAVWIVVGRSELEAFTNLMKAVQGRQDIPQVLFKPLQIMWVDIQIEFSEGGDPFIDWLFLTPENNLLPP